MLGTKHNVHCENKKFADFWKKFDHFSNILPSWGPYCPDCSSSCSLSSSGQQKGWFAVGLGVFCEYIHIPNLDPKRGLWWLSKEECQVVVFWAKGDPIWAKWDTSGQFVQKVGKNVLELGNKIQSYVHNNGVCSIHNLLGLRIQQAYLSDLSDSMKSRTALLKLHQEKGKLKYYCDQ